MTMKPTNTTGGNLAGKKYQAPQFVLCKGAMKCTAIENTHTSKVAVTALKAKVSVTTVTIPTCNQPYMPNGGRAGSAAAWTRDKHMKNNTSKDSPHDRTVITWPTTHTSTMIVKVGRFGSISTGIGVGRSPTSISQTRGNEMVTKTTKESAAYLEGYHSGRKGKGPKSNPYTNEPEFGQWFTGWVEAEHHEVFDEALDE